MMSGDDVRVAKGDLFWVDLGPRISSAPAKRRPVVVVQSDDFNRSRLATVVVASVSSNTALADHPGNVFLSIGASGLPKDSVVNISALVTLDKSDLAEGAGTLPGYLVDDIDSGLRLLLDLR